MSAMIARYLKDFSAPKLPAVTEAMDDAMFDFPSFAEVEPTVDAEASTASESSSLTDDEAPGASSPNPQGAR